MTKYIQASGLSGEIFAPASKSYAQRAIACALLAKGETTIHNYTPCADSEAALALIANLGASVVKEGRTLKIKGCFPFVPTTFELDCHEAGLGIRMFSSIVALFDQQLTLVGAGSLKTRPMDGMQTTLQQLGAQFDSQNGFLPLHITGPLQGGHAELDGSLSSQSLTGLLIALTQAVSPSTLDVKQLKSHAYIDMTIEVLNAFGATIEHSQYQRFSITPQPLHSTSYNIEGDWSGAALLLVAGAIAGEITVCNLDVQSKQADRTILDVLKASGAQLTFAEDTVRVAPPSQGKKLQAFRIDATNCPDLFPPLAALAACCEGTSYITGIHRLKHKESDRALVLQELLSAFGIKIYFEEDMMVIHGGEVAQARVSGYNDHRIAMTAAILALRATGEVTLEGAECVSKSYPHFFEDLSLLGATIR